MPRFFNTGGPRDPSIHHMVPAEARSNFTEPELRMLYAQQTAETGQPFEERALGRAYEPTTGQPWLVNALARLVVQNIATDRTRPIDERDIDRACEQLIERQDTHLDSLAERLRDPRVGPVIASMLVGDPVPPLPADDLPFVQDLGLVREGSEGKLEVANPIYRETVARERTSSVKAAVPKLRETWRRADGRLDADALLAAFVELWREHGETLSARAPYAEAAAHLVLMAFSTAS